MARVDLKKVVKRFGKVEVVHGIDLEINDVEFVVLVGPSGCGKSTTLRMVAGLEEISDGEIYIDDQRINDVAPKDRGVAMVFQNYALYPHMNVYNNMAFGLKLRKTPKAEIEERVQRAAGTLGLTELLKRKPHELSGGQRQRVAMGRAMVREPRAFLLDEPLSNLDAKLRVQMRTEIARLQRRLGTTTLYVTHDQTEAMTLGDRIAVLRHGELQQLGTPRELYQQPRNLFVAGFIGSPAMNFFPAELRDNQWIELPMGKAPLPEKTRRRLPAGRSAFVAGIRPEHLQDTASSAEDSEYQLKFSVCVDVVEWLGAELFVHFDVAGVTRESLPSLPEELELDAASSGTLRRVARIDTASPARAGEQLELNLDVRRLHLFDPESGTSLF